MSDDLKDNNVINDTDNPTETPELQRSCSRDQGLLTEFQVFVLDPNTSGSVAIPIALSPLFTEVAELSALTTPPSFLVIDEYTDRVWLNATIGWQAITNGTGVDRVEVLFSIYRDSLPPTGTLIFLPLIAVRQILRIIS
ncbi:hypothetical protein N752_28565 [Desulforamulus aquiferis]|nr:hypothetical protein [Desulforamulus aquiferis]RYD01812.1 hypothetical protein N752_28565 [Desulforamulus aquiferis]